MVRRLLDGSPEGIKKLCDGFGITIQDFFDAEQFHDLEQEVK